MFGPACDQVASSSGVASGVDRQTAFRTYPVFLYLQFVCVCVLVLSLDVFIGGVVFFHYLLRASFKRCCICVFGTVGCIGAFLLAF